ncbi:MAG: hypothetical protein Q4P16_08340 [Spirochaetales bacterium]|nr:hypothetical protein [Spirochaetales bacterium]
MTEQYENNNEDEISLIDLFAVLIRYRKLVVIGTFAVALAAFAWLFVLPNFIPSLNKKTLTISYALKTERLPASVASSVNYSILSTAINYMKDVRVLADVQREFSIFADEKKASSVSAYNRQIQDAIDKEKFVVGNSPIADTIAVTLKVSMEKEEFADAFIKKIAKMASDYIEADLMPEIDTLEDNANTILEKYGDSGLSEKKSSASASASVNYADISADIKSFKSKHDEFVKSLDDAFVIKDPAGRAMKFIVVAFAAFFIFVFIAFLLNAVANIKTDPYASNIIKKAWDEGK